MNDKWERYRAQPNEDKWEQYRAEPKKTSAPKVDEREHLNTLKKQHPLIYALAEKLQGNPQLEKAGELAGHFNKAVEGTGLPSLAKGFYGTGTEIGRGLTNLIPGVHIPKQQYNELDVNPYVGESAETIGSLGMGLPIYRGYQTAKKGIEALTYAKKVPELIRNVLAGSATGAAISPESRGLGATLGGAAETVPFAVRGIKNAINNYRVAPKEKAFYKAMLEHEMQKQEEDSLKSLASHEFGKNNPESLLLSAADKKAQLESAQAFKNNRMQEEPMLPGQQTIPEAEYHIAQTDQALRQQLGEGEPNVQDLSRHIVEAIEGKPVIEPNPKTGLPREVRYGGERKAWGAKMDELENNLPEIEIPSTDTKAVNSALKSYFGKKSDVSEADKENFKKLITPSYTKNKKINGRQFFRAYRSLRSIEGQERSKAFGLDPKSHDEWIDRANETKKTYEDMENIIKKYFPEDTMSRLYQLNHEYSNKIAPLHENPLYQQMLKHGQYKGDVIESLSGTTKGNKILREMIQNNPELSRLALGHSFSEKPQNLLKPNKLIEPYVNANPEIANLLGSQKQAQEQLNVAKQNENLYKQVEKIPQLQKEIKEQTRIAKRLKDEAEITGLSKAEVAKRKLALEKAERKVRNMKRTLLGATSLAGAYAIKKALE